MRTAYPQAREASPNDSQVFFVPLPARPLLRAARDLLTAHNSDPQQRVFAGFSPIHESVEQAAAQGRAGYRATVCAGGTRSGLGSTTCRRAETGPFTGRRPAPD